MNLSRILKLVLYIILKPKKAFCVIKEEKVFLDTATIFICCSLATGILYRNLGFKIAAVFVLIDILLTVLFAVCIYYIARRWKQYDISIIKILQIFFVSSVIGVISTIVDVTFPCRPAVINLIIIIWLIVLTAYGMYIIFSLSWRKIFFLSFVYLFITVIFALGLLNMSMFKEIIDVEYRNDVKALQKKIIERPENIDNYTRLGMLHGKYHEYDKAIEAFKQGLEVAIGLEYRESGPECSKILLYNIGLNMLAKKDINGSIKALKGAIDLDSTYIPALQVLGLAYYEKSANKEAIETWEKVLQIEPDNKWTLKRIHRIKK